MLPTPNDSENVQRVDMLCELAQNALKIWDKKSEQQYSNNVNNYNSNIIISRQ